MQDPIPAQRPTLLVFTLGAETEGRRRRLLPQALRDRETALYRACLDEALTAGRACGFRLAVSAPRRALDEGREPDVTLRAQGEGGFGDRLAAAFDAAGPAPGAPVMVVGTDTPGLGADRLRRAAAALAHPTGPTGLTRSGRVVIGPSPDGGLYLLAADRPLGELLRRVPWRRRRTLAALTRELERAGLAVHLLPPLADLDHPADLDAWLARRRSASAEALDRLAAALGRLLAALRRPFVLPPAATPRPAVVPVRAGRAPPRRPL
ncbi:MAG TPA: DUF2064 domain-containing protein [Thermoanaerobaculia bacterium]